MNIKELIKAIKLIESEEEKLKSIGIDSYEQLETYIKLAEEKENAGLEKELMPKDAFIHPISVKTFLRYAKNNQEIDFAQYGKDTQLEKAKELLK